MHKLGKVRSRQLKSKEIEDVIKKRPLSTLLSDAYLGLRVDEHVEHVIKNKYDEYVKPHVENQIEKYLEDLIRRHILLPGTLMIQLHSDKKDEYGFFILPNGLSYYFTKPAIVIPYQDRDY